MLESITKATLLTNVNWMALGPAQQTSYERYFLRSNMEKLVPQFCDRVFWKILILLSKDICNFDEIIMGLFKSKK